MIKRFLSQLVSQRSGATAIEYALMITLVCLAIFTAVGTMGNKVSDTFGNVATGLN